MEYKQIILNYNIRYDEEEKLYNLEDIIYNIVESKDKKSYIRALKNKNMSIIKKNKQNYVNEETLIKICQYSNSQNCKDIIDKINELYKKDNKINVINEDDNIFIFNGCSIYVFEINGDAWFKGVDIAKLLEYSNTNDAIIKHVKNKHKKTFEELSKIKSGKGDRDLGDLIPPNPKIDKQTIMINEAGLYSLIFRSKMKEAEKFTDWVIEEVLPSIRKKGMYVAENTKNSITIDFREYKDKYCVYLFETNQNGIYKYGDTSDIKNRMKSHRSTFHNITITKIYTFDDFRQMKKMAHQIKKYIHDININYIDDTKQVELFKTTNEKNINEILKKLNSFYEKNNCNININYFNRM